MPETTTIFTLFALAAAWAVFAVGFPYAWILTSKINRLERDRKQDSEDLAAIRKEISELLDNERKNVHEEIERFREAFARNPRAFEPDPANYETKRQAIEQDIRKSNESFQHELAGLFDKLLDRIQERYEHQLDDINSSIRPAIFLIGLLGVVAVCISGYFLIFR